MIIKQCIICKKEFKVFPYRNDTAYFCSRKCSGISKIGKKHSPEHKQKISIGIKNHLPSTAYKKGQRPSIQTEFKKGEVSWNKGKKFPKQTGEKNRDWKGDSVSYSGMHHWIKRQKGKPQICEHCGITSKTNRLNWANIDHKYRRKLDDYFVLCASCHKFYDKKYN